jgi:hypothetical protein
MDLSSISTLVIAGSILAATDQLEIHRPFNSNSTTTETTRSLLTVHWMGRIYGLGQIHIDMQLFWMASFNLAPSAPPSWSLSIVRLLRQSVGRKAFQLTILRQWSADSTRKGLGFELVYKREK